MNNVVQLYPEPEPEPESSPASVTVLPRVHRDMTDKPALYAAPKPFVFLSKKQLRAIASSRHARQVLKEQNAVSVHELTCCPSYRIDKLAEFLPKFNFLDFVAGLLR